MLPRMSDMQTEHSTFRGARSALDLRACSATCFPYLTAQTLMQAIPGQSEGHALQRSSTGSISRMGVAKSPHSWPAADSLL